MTSEWKDVLLFAGVVVVGLVVASAFGGEVARVLVALVGF
jgi:hypothetical protein